MNDVTTDRPAATKRYRGPRVSQQRYMLRRIGALVVLSALVVVSTKLVTVLGGSDDVTADSGVTTVPVAVGDPSLAGASGAVGGAVAAPSVSNVTGTVADPTTAVTIPAASPVVNTGPPSAANSVKLLIAGDSDAGTFGPYLESLLSDTGMVTTELDYKVSSGLSRPDFFNWPQHFRETIPTVAASIVVVTFGGNDPQGLANVDGNFIVGMPTGESGGDLEWRAEYGRRVGEVMDFLAADGRTLVWVGIPNDDNPDVTARLDVQNEVVRAEIAKRPNVVFVDTWKRFSGRNGNWAEFVIDPRDGVGKDVRADDGFHLNEAGAQIQALDITEVIKGILRARGAAI